MLITISQQLIHPVGEMGSFLYLASDEAGRESYLGRLSKSRRNLEFKYLLGKMLLEASITRCRSQGAADWVPLNVLQDPTNRFCSFTFYLKCHVAIAMITNIYCVQHYAKCFPHIVSLNKNTPSCPQRIF